METDTYWKFVNLNYIETNFNKSNPRIPLGGKNEVDVLLFYLNAKYFMQKSLAETSGSAVRIPHRKEGPVGRDKVVAQLLEHPKVDSSALHLGTDFSANLKSC